ncbi:uncharacterized protein N7500_009284 [Penicillium coprophilum]|uniref:uncharacterized protein n=1 Tax=Penicillium coprophilum TaxID=36646 RepID=UPI002392777F|nr:uncharacterized protein N7500_009284 [Penicillium coprophilum]KAJ5153845.1 hypothetical protein N7500_009284 [Penicillium coprophilum]
MESTTAKKRPRVDEADGPDDYDDCPLGKCRPCCHRCDRKHSGACTAFCRKCAEIGHSWRRCRLFVPHQIWVKRHYGMHTIIQNVNITLPVINPGLLVTTTFVNAAILSQLDAALSHLHKKAGIPLDSRITMNNVNIKTNIIASVRAAPIAPDTSLLDRVQRIPTGPRSNIPNNKPRPMKSAFAQSDFTHAAGSKSLFNQPVFGQSAFSQPKFMHDSSVGMTPSWPRYG